MKTISETIVFFGSGPVAAESLRLLVQNFEIEAVITKPRPPHHKGAVPVLELAEQLKLPTLTAMNKKELDELIRSRPVRSRLAVLIDFGIIVSQEVIDYFELGIINSHFSLLPEWRGADPITFSILSGQKTTGISLMLLTAGMDEGPLLCQAEYDIEPTETTRSLTARLIELSDHALQTVLPLYLHGETQAVPQETFMEQHGSSITFSRKLTKEDAILDFSKPAVVLEREIRAFIEWPKSKTTLGDVEVSITKARVSDAAGTAGSLSLVGKELLIACSEGSLVIEQLKPAGKAEMTASAFLAGYGPRLNLIKE